MIRIATGRENRQFFEVMGKPGKFFDVVKVREFVSEVKCVAHKVQPKAERG